jgi:drug/metabolite transporter (DMT)-like permease
MKTKAFILIILAGIFWGTSVIFVNITAPYGYTSIQMTAIRSVVSALSMAIYILILNRKLFKIKLSELILLSQTVLHLLQRLPAITHLCS